MIMEFENQISNFLSETIDNVQVGRIPFNEQIKNFEQTLDQITDTLGVPDVAQALSKCIFFVGMGSNDYLNNYLMPNYDTKNHYNPQQFADLLAQQYSQQLNVSYQSKYPVSSVEFAALLKVV